MLFAAFPIFSLFIGTRFFSFSVDSVLTSSAGIMAITVQTIATYIDSYLVADSADSNSVGSYIITQNQGAITHAHCPQNWAIAINLVLS